MIAYLRSHLRRLLLASTFIVLSASTLAWTLRDRTPPPWDPSDHIRYAYDYYRLLAHADLAGFAGELFTTRHYYAPLVHLLGSLVFLVVGASRISALAVNLVSLAATLWAVAWISRHLYGGPDTSGGFRAAGSAQRSVALEVLPALLAVCYHFSAWLMHDAFLDFPLAAAVTVAFAALIRAGDFGDRRKALAFGLAAGLGMMVKQTFAFFFLLPAIYVAARVLYRRDTRALLNLLLAALVLTLIAAVWYAPHAGDVIAIYRENQRSALSENEASLFGFDSNFFYVHALISMQMQLPLALLFGAGLVYSLIRCPRQSVLVYLWLLSGLASFALVANKDVRYTVPVLPAAALLSVCWLREFSAQASIPSPARALKPALVALIAGWAFVSFFNAQWPNSGWGTAIDTPRYRWMVFARNYYGFDHRPLEDDWSVPEIVRAVAALPREHERAPTESAAQTVAAATRADTAPVLGVVVNLPYLNPSSVALYSRLLTKERAGSPLIDVRWVVEPTMLNRLEECDYVLVRNGLDKADWVAGVEREVERLIREDTARFIRVASFPIPLEGAEAVVYRHQNSTK